MTHRILIVDDETGIRQALKQVLEYEDMVVRVTSSVARRLPSIPSFVLTWSSSM